MAGANIRVGIVIPLSVLMAVAFPGLAQEIKKKTELATKKQWLAFPVAERKEDKGRGAGTAFVKGIAAGPNGAINGVGVPDEPDHSDNPDYNPAFDPAVGLSLRAGMRCYTQLGDKMVVLGADGNRILVELDRANPRYMGSRELTAHAPAITNGALTFTDVENTPVCLQQVKLWIDHDVFVALQSLSMPPKRSKKNPKSTTKDGDSADDQDAVRRALGK